MALLFRVVYPSGEETFGTGYPGSVLVVREVPPGPESAYLDEIEVDFAVPEPLPVRRIVGGPRRATIRVRVDGTDAERDRWMDDREREGFVTGLSPAEAGIVLCAPYRDGLDPLALEAAGAVILQAERARP